MKKMIICATLFIAGYSAAFAQDEKYMMAMEPKVTAVDTTRNPVDLMALSAAFERIADAEKNKMATLLLCSAGPGECCLYDRLTKTRRL
jgi:hypothetical protein